jgi:hypothetical protein
MCLFKRKKKVYEKVDSKFDIGDSVYFRYKEELYFGYVTSVRKNAEDIMIRVNTSLKPFSRPVITYKEVVALAGFVASGNNKGYTVSYTNGPDTNPSGDLLPGESVKVQNMMNFTVSGTVVS